MENVANSRLNILVKTTSAAQPLIMIQMVNTGVQQRMNLTGIWADRAGVIAQVSLTFAIYWWFLFLLTNNRIDYQNDWKLLTIGHNKNKTHTYVCKPYFYHHSLWLRANARNVSLETLYGGQFASSTQLIKANYLVTLPHRRSTTVSLETCLLNSCITVITMAVASYPSNERFVTGRCCTFLKKEFLKWRVWINNDVYKS